MVKLNKKLLVTFDLELFLGAKSGTLSKSIIEPTQYVLDILEKYKINSIFFIDTLYLHMLHHYKEKYDELSTDFNELMKFLKSMVETGRIDVFHHLHPHWIDAKYIPETRMWDLSDKSRFSLNNFTSSDIDYFFKVSDSYISNIYRSSRKPTILGFRAGGLYAEPFSKLKGPLIRYNVLHDFSLLKGASSYEEFGSYDYSKVPSHDIYNFEDDLKEFEPNGIFTEYSINQFEMFGFNKIRNSIYYRLNSKKDSWKRIGDGNGSGNKLISKLNPSILDKLKTKETYSIELMNKFKGSLYLKDFESKDYIHMISHPKLFSKENIVSFESFIKKASNKYNLTTNYKEMGFID